MSRYPRIALLSAWVQVQQRLARSATIVVTVVQPLFIALIAVFMLRHSPGFEPTYVIVGVGLSAIWSLMLFNGTEAIVAHRSFGTFEFLEASPVPLIVIIGGQMVANVAISIAPMALSYTVVALLFGYPIVISEPFAFLVSLLLALFALWAMGMLFAPLYTLVVGVRNFMIVLEYPVYILSGFLFPVALLPTWSLPLSYALPPYWAARALHGSGLGLLSLGELVQSWFVLLATGLLVLALAAGLFDLVQRTARRQGLPSDWLHD